MNKRYSNTGDARKQMFCHRLMAATVAFTSVCSVLVVHLCCPRSPCPTCLASPTCPAVGTENCSDGANQDPTEERDQKTSFVSIQWELYPSTACCGTCGTCQFLSVPTVGYDFEMLSLTSRFLEVVFVRLRCLCLVNWFYGGISMSARNWMHVLRKMSPRGCLFLVSLVKCRRALPAEPQMLRVHYDFETRLQIR